MGDSGTRGAQGSRSPSDPGPASPHGEAPPVADPFADRSPTAQRLLAAARRLLARDGFRGLTFEAVTTEAGENRAAIRYHFGNKDGFITALVDSIDHDDSARLIGELAAADQHEDRVGLLLGIQREGCKEADEAQLFFDLLPHVLRDPALRARLGRLYDWYRDVDSWVIAPDVDDARRAEAEHLAALAIAVVDGITMQYAADRGFDVDGAYAVWERMLRGALAGLGAGERPAAAGTADESPGADRAAGSAAKDAS